MIERLVWDYGLVHEVAESTALVIGLSLGQSQSAPIRDQVMWSLLTNLSKPYKDEDMIVKRV